MKRTLILGLFAAGAAVLVYVALIDDPAVPLGPPQTAVLTRYHKPDNQAQERLTPTAEWTAELADGTSVSGRSTRHADHAPGETVCLQRFRREASGYASASILSTGPCP
ncbi:MAG: hypothetical protein AAFS07_03055 [Pseudomonadota bacterium]